MFSASRCQDLDAPGGEVIAAIRLPTNAVAEAVVALVRYSGADPEDVVAALRDNQDDIDPHDPGDDVEVTVEEIEPTWLTHLADRHRGGSA